ncbi:MAG: protein-L-isoaspartate(D-aspartate) O-methyltransferase [Planctomycetaceae bacterium]|nr:protein-L-isoaspartate(D-aspartate) O-methyltransferase [Planctomycetaceae bacterium]
MTDRNRQFDETARLRLCDKLRDRGITDERVLAAISRVPRERFVPAELHDDAYADIALPIGEGQTISQPYIVALMTQSLMLTGEETVLEIGTGSGYQASVLSQLCRWVITVERLRKLAEPTQVLLQELNVSNVTFYIGDGTLGCPDLAPYDGILVTAAAPDIPAPLFEQLQEGGRLIIPVGTVEEQTLLRVTKKNNRPVSEALCECRFVKLIGEAGWPE